MVDAVPRVTWQRPYREGGRSISGLVIRKRRSGTPRESCKIPGHAVCQREPTFSHAAWRLNWPIAVRKLAAVPLSVPAMIGVLPPRRCVAGGSSCYVLMGNVDRKGGGDA
jgi:hypothetical protein